MSAGFENAASPREDSVFLVIDDPKWQFGGRAVPAIDGHGVAVLELDRPAVVTHLLELFELENPECPFGFDVVPRGNLSPVQLVIINREVQKSHDIGINLDNPDYCTDDPTYAA